MLGEECGKCGVKVVHAIILADLVEHYGLCRLLSHLDMSMVDSWGDMCRWFRVPIKVPQHKPVESSDLLILFKPEGHLGKFILVICGGICTFCKINVEVFRVFSVVVVSGAEEFDG